MTFGDALKEGETYLKECRIPDAQIDAWYLLEFVLKDVDGGVNRTWFLLNRQEQMEPAQYARYQGLLKERGRRIPLQHITGEQEFMGIPFLVNDKVLIPRQDTEILVEEAMGSLKPGMKVLDMCTGSGCIIISLLKLVPGIVGTGADISQAALFVAGENARLQGVDVEFCQGNLFESIRGRFDLIVSNPPYIPTKEIEKLMDEVRLHDPVSALDGRADGLHFYRKIITDSRAFLEDGGWLMVEIGHDQSVDVAELLQQAGYTEISVIRDLSGLDRVVKGKLADPR